ncbi:MAG: hypothetical protein U9O66_02660, partial [Patescibacteria group bacterium]|nr:hypothetical protein [Patescibacteria group bacterium]
MFIIITILTFNLFFFQSAVIGVIFGAFYFFILSKKLTKKLHIGLMYAFLLVLSIVSFIGAAVYYFYELNNISITAVIIITYLIILKKNKIKNFQFQILNF